jgi:hypothetical protein
METKRVLVIEKLVLAIPDQFQSDDGRDEVSIDDALRYLLQYRQTAKAVLQNRVGNFTYFAADYPDDVIPEDASSFTKDKLLCYLLNEEKKEAVGMMATLIYDEDLKAYRNCYDEKEQKRFNAQKEQYMQYLQGNLPTEEEDEAEEESDEEDAEIASENQYGDNWQGVEWPCGCTYDDGGTPDHTVAEGEYWPCDHCEKDMDCEDCDDYIPQEDPDQCSLFNEEKEEEPEEDGDVDAR